MPLRLVSLDGHPDIPLDHVIVVGRDHIRLAYELR